MPEGRGMKKIIGMNIILWNKFIIAIATRELGIDFKIRFQVAWRKAANRIRKKIDNSVI